MSRRAEFGFTLLELLVTLTIAVLALSLVIPRLDGAMATAELKGEARKVASLLRHARTQAVLSNQETRVRLNLEPLELIGDDQLVPYRPPGEIRLTLSAGASASEQSATQASEQAIRFFPAGGSSGGQVVVSLADGRQAAVGVDWLSGRVRIDE